MSLYRFPYVINARVDLLVDFHLVVELDYRDDAQKVKQDFDRSFQGKYRFWHCFGLQLKLEFLHAAFLILLDYIPMVNKSHIFITLHLEYVVYFVPRGGE
jgi:hypothetical protein